MSFFPGHTCQTLRGACEQDQMGALVQHHRGYSCGSHCGYPAPPVLSTWDTATCLLAPLFSEPNATPSAGRSSQLQSCPLPSTPEERPHWYKVPSSVAISAALIELGLHERQHSLGKSPAQGVRDVGPGIGSSSAPPTTLSLNNLHL